LEQLISLLNENTVYHFLLLLARIVSFMVFMPIFGHQSISSNIRIALSFYFTIFMLPLVNFESTFTTSQFVSALISEIMLGLIGAFFIKIIFSAVEIIGDLLGYATTLSMASMFDPATGTQQGVVSRFLYLIVLVSYFQTGMYQVTLLMLANSFDTIILGSFNLFEYNGITIVIKEIKNMFAFAFAFAFPLFFIGFIIDIYYGYGTRATPAFSPFVITFQIKFTVIFIFLLLGMDIFVESFKDYFIAKLS
jgi:flagellar biosynthetic protein FliR